MVAVMDTRYDNLGSDNSPGQSATITNLRFNAEDTNDQDLLSPLTIPSSGTIFSFWKQCYMRCTTAPDTQVDNVQIYSDGSLGWGSGVTAQIGNETPLHSSIVTTGYDLATAQENMINHTDITANTSLFTFTSVSTKSISISEAGSIINTANETTNYIVLQLDVESTASPGTKPIETITWQYDEI
jgi:hypothetical protein